MSPYAHSEESHEPSSFSPMTEPISAFSPATPPLGNHEPERGDMVEQLLDAPDPIASRFIDNSSLTSTDVKADPILSALARRQQSQGQASAGTPTKVMFKARPAPSSTRAVGLGPKMTKSAALRLGLKWDEVRPRRVTGEKRDEVVKGTPGYKRVGLGITVPSLAAPSVAPRATKSSQLRAGGQGSTPIKSARKDPEAIIAANKARALEEKERRRKSIALPSSLSAPSIAPRQNKSSLLRTGGQIVKSPTMAKSPISTSSLTRTMSALKVTSVANFVEPNDDTGLDQQKHDEKAKTRSSMAGVRSLGAPSIAPRLNKAALLRAPTSSTSMPSFSSLPTIQAKVLSTPSTKSAVASVRSAAKTAASPSVGPRPTKSSLLRAAQGTKVLV
ncbi:hypothetical protein IAR55_005364 [Kwoniella newhampshirensis]|uniref:Uncharacterized protein n=1 Tax=Kwoniella newhampshirensis TaxID=1651941 RepID=A0AAW0YIA9_9TREE